MTVYGQAIVPDRGSWLRVLVVDDSKTMRNLISMALQGSFETLQARDGVDALEKYPVFKPHIILLDLDMPRMGGLEVIDAVRTGYKDCDTFIIVLSGHEETSLKTDALNRGANDYVTKPLHPEELKARAQVAGRQMMLNQELREAYARISDEMTLVASLQHQLLPREDVTIDELEIKHLYRPSGQASGDYYDFFRMADDRIRLVLADMAGKGARAAFLMAIVQAFFRLSGRENYSLDKTMSLINRHLLEISPSGSDFATVFAGDIDLPSQSLTYINAGHCPGLLLLPSGNASRLEAQGYPLGVVESDYPCATCHFPRGSSLFLYTDGMFEWELDQSRMLSIEEFLREAEIAHSKGGQFLEVLAVRLAMLTKSSPRYTDDQTALWVKRTGGEHTATTSGASKATL